MKATIVPGVSTWSVYQADRAMDFNGFFIETEQGHFVVDPIEPDEATLQWLAERGVAAVLITNRDHERATGAVVAATGASVIASTREAPLLSIPPTRVVDDGDGVFGWRVVALDGAKPPGEIALHDPVSRTAIVGDLLWGAPAGALALMPEAKLADPARAALSARRLRGLNLEHLLVGDGAHVFGRACERIGAAIAHRTDVAIARVNVHDLAFKSSSADLPPYDPVWAEVGHLLGAKRLGYLATRLRKGKILCPFHWHTREEELFVVISGTPSVRTPQGTWRLRVGDCIAFPTDPSGAHSLFNEADEDAVVLLVANTDEGDVCFYPDSRKHLVEATGTLVRSEPILDYFEGELR